MLINVPLKRQEATHPPFLILSERVTHEHMSWAIVVFICGKEKKSLSQSVMYRGYTNNDQMLLNSAFSKFKSVPSHKSSEYT